VTPLLTSRAIWFLGATAFLGAPAVNHTSGGSTPSRASAVARPALAEPAISPDHREIAFVSGGDIWTVAAAGGAARLLVAHAANESRPLYSPDGSRLAFISTRTGNGDIYVLTLNSGELRRVTYDDVNDQLDAWSHDGRWLYFSSSSKDISGMNDIFRVSAGGGTPMQVSADRYANEYWSAPSPTDSTTIAFTGKGRTSADWWRKGHSHIDESEIWLRHDGASAPRYEQVTAGNARDAWPMWSADGASLYYVSDRGGTENIWQHALPAGQPRQLTSFRDGRVVWPSMSADGRTIAFERDFGVWTLDVASGKASEVAITLRGASAASGIEHLTLSTGLQSLALSPDGKKIVFSARGELFAASARDGGDATRITATPAPETQPNWAPDSRRLAYVSSRDGSSQLYVYDFATRAETRLTSGPLSDVDLRWSPDGKSIAFMRGARELRVIDVATRQERLLATGYFDRPPFVSDRAVAWSPDGKWIAYLSAEAQQFQNAYVVPAAGGNARPVSFLPNVFGNTIAWSPDGSYLLFDTSQRTEAGQVARVDLVPRTPRFREDQFRDLFRDQPTRPGSPIEPTPARPAPPRRDSAGLRADSARGTDRVPTTIVFDDIRRRVSMLPVGVDAGSVVISPDGKMALLTAAAAGQQNLYTYSLNELSRETPVARQLTSTPGFKSGAQFSPDGKEVYYVENGRINVITIGSRQVRTIAVSAELDVDFGVEKNAVFNQAWTTLADNFFDAKMHGVDWKGAHERYAPYVEGARTGDELRRILRFMIGELNASHSGVNGASFSPQANVGRLGLRFDRAEYERGGRLRVAEVLPLGPGALSGIVVGDYLLAVDGTRIDARTNLDSLMLYKTNRRVALSVSGNGVGAATRQVAIRPVSGATEKGLVYRDWVESRRAYVATVSNGRLGYVHMPDMGAGSLAQLYLDLDTENRSREGVIIDIRNNNGGFVNAYALDVFARRPYLNFTYREFSPSAGRSVLGQRALERPTALVTNMHSLSDAEDFTEGYRALGLGPVIGEPTAGWIIFTSNVPLIDGSSLRVPFIRITDRAGRDMEMHPRQVDVPVVRPVGESYAGRDAQLDAAVNELLKRVVQAGSSR
jgi:tricorn protease